MQLELLDLLIIGLYLVSTVVIGIYLKKQASKNMESYFLGGNTLPWYMLGLSNASGMFDISGTMWMVYLCFVYGLKSVWIPWLWPAFNQIFLMIYLSIWLRRSNVLTGAEWIRTRFGDGTGGKLSHMVVVFFALLSCLGFLSYGFIGIGKFIEIFIPWSVVSGYVPFELTAEQVPYAYGILFTTIATFYVVMGGMLSIVWTDVIQFGIMTVSALVIAGIAMYRVDAETLMAMVPSGWNSPFFGYTIDMNWSSYIPSVNNKITDDSFSPFSIFFMMMLFKGFFASMAGPAPNFDMQKILSTKSPKEAAKMSGFVSAVMFLPRYLMIGGFTILAVVYFSGDINMAGGNFDFENILPMAIKEFVPSGLMGLLLAGLLAAFMSTFASTVNAAPAYLVNDIYLRYINPNASGKLQMRASYIISAAVVVISTVIGMYVQNINSVLQWIVSALYGGYIAANFLKWHWWRFNGHGFFFGMSAGIAASMIFPLIFKETLELYYFPVLFAVSLIGAILGTLLTPPTEEKTLKQFYKNVRPWGFWGPIKRKVMLDDPNFVPNKDFGKDMFNVVIGITWQATLSILPLYIVIKEEMGIVSSAAVLVITTLILKKNWYDKLPEDTKPVPKVLIEEVVEEV
ncbi:sodium:solute symporter family protein [Flammeovirga kamogawensis]|uniref:Na+:solute symporter n=1 Tax=Flammeovirga kamogawensis TaxID=373891 RepID=A0ABX8H5L6_9BACT|nr:sodium:solute symporter family protein [Flammeovirga kamogawensis]MBB6461724.1 Na+/proline symporter [Flammeovirga kamogawensis]QWG10642.1 Na+:solute symporter [Flammeovirga kamogawensis]TRX63747.1 Na+:solute symporter [Flammeovirga kamogawensis]